MAFSVGAGEWAVDAAVIRTTRAVDRLNRSGHNKSGVAV